MAPSRRRGARDGAPETAAAVRSCGRVIVGCSLGISGGFCIHPTLQVILRSVGAFGVLGATLGIGALIMLGSNGAFDEGGATSLQAALALGMTLIVAPFVALAVAFVAGAHAARILPDRSSSALAAGAGAGVGHLAMLLVLFVVLGIGFAVFMPAPDASQQPFGAQAEPTAVDWSQFGALAWGALMSLVAGAASAALFHQRPAPRRAAAQATTMVATRPAATQQPPADATQTR